jgi:hypothetical protein
VGKGRGVREEEGGGVTDEIRDSFGEVEEDLLSGGF